MSPGEGAEGTGNRQMPPGERIGENPWDDGWRAWRLSSCFSAFEVSSGFSGETKSREDLLDFPGPRSPDERSISGKYFAAEFLDNANHHHRRIHSMNPISDNKSNLLNDVEIVGSIVFKGELTFDGQLKNGDIKGGKLTVGSKARVEGNVETETLTLHGTVKGDVLVTGKCDLKGSANLVGSLTTNRLAMDEGATLIGQAEITPEAKKRPAA
jgi:cytoskeletal protein CcmA (bactofilin family)